jgi:ABC-type uncharacterized transport system ATPase subunit
MTAGPAIQIDGLIKTYDGGRALDGMSFTVPRGSICGFVGPNGAGKTTTLRIVMGFAFPEFGSTRVLGAGMVTPPVLGRIGFVPEVKELYPFARAGEMIRLTRGFYPHWDHALEATRMVNRGRTVLEGALDDIKQRHRRGRLVIERDGVQLPAALAHWQRDGRFLTGLSDEAPEALAARLAGDGVIVLDAQPATLKDVFLDHVSR